MAKKITKKTVEEPIKEEIIEEVIVEPVEVIEEVIAEPVYFGVVTGCERLRVRSGKNIESSILEVIESNTKVEITDSFDEWYGVKTPNGTVGFCMKDYIKI